ncbi:MAG: hypothetical protein M1829_003565 [Trizodia sp. TS-e1964]|nr:MAG: hypothetical protein M1829_003565 [Trizodia sp. TS-e1964]
MSHTLITDGSRVPDIKVPPDEATAHHVVDISQASSIQEILAAANRLSEQEATVTSRLNSLVTSQQELIRDLGRLDILRARLGSQFVTTRSLSHGILSSAASTADRISSAVKQLDLEQSRVKATLEVVEQVSELKSCILGVVGSMGGPQDWEMAAGFLSRALKIPPGILNGQFAEEIVPTAEVPDPPHVTLDAASESLCGLFLREFDKAAKAGEDSTVTRFFKLFPLIGRANVGLDVYGRYVCQGVASRARQRLNSASGENQRKEGYFYANALTKLFEHIAQIIEGHGGLVQRHYGAGKMVTVMERLQLEADVQGGIIVDSWSEDRSVDRRLTDIKSYAFSFLVQSFLPPPKPAAGVSRANSPAVREAAGLGRNSEDEGVNMKEIDGLSSEIALMLGRWSLYSRFVATKCKGEDIIDDEKSPLALPPLISSSQLHRKINDRLIQPFIIMATFFFRRSVEKAFQLDELPANLSLSSTETESMENQPFITSAVDDVMFIAKKVLRQSLDTSQLAVVSSCVPIFARVLGSDFIGMIQRKMRDESYPKAAIQGALPPEHKVVLFLVLINNLDLAGEYLKRIIQAFLESSTLPKDEAELDPESLAALFPFENEYAQVLAILHSMQISFEGKALELIADSIHVTFNQVVKPRIRPILGDAFRDADYHMAEEEWSGKAHDNSNADTSDPDLTQRRFEYGWDSLMKPLKHILTERNYDRLLSTTTQYVGKMLEKRIWSYHGRVNDFGAMRLERDIANIINSVAKGGRYGLRDAFLRCSQICMIMNMEPEEWEEANNEDESGKVAGVLWKLDEEERGRARSIRRQPGES